MSLKNIIKLPNLPKLPKRFEGTIVERWANYWRGLMSDYKDVALDSYKTIKTNPKKSVIYGSLGAFLYGSYKTNPSAIDFKDQIAKSEISVGLVNDFNQNPETTKYIKFLNQNINTNTLRITSLGFFSIMWIADYSKDQATFDATCEYLKPQLKTFHNRIIDIGWWNNWWNLDKNMKDYDVNF